METLKDVNLQGWFMIMAPAGTPAPLAPRPRTAPVPYVAPRTAAEELVADLWSELLGVGGVGLYSDFFASGGHSLLAMKMLARLRGTTGVRVPLRTVFRYPGLEQFAAAVEEALLADLADLSDADAEALLAAEEGPTR